MDGLTDIFEMKETAALPETDLFGDAVEVKGQLRDRFIEPPFSVLNANGGEWMKRKRAWLRLGIKSEIGREGFETYGQSIVNLREKLGGSKVSTISIFDPVVCELMYRWFCPEAGWILDPFAGGSVRGIVARYLGFNYVGNDISEKQILANRENAGEIFGADTQLHPNWFIGDSEAVLKSCPRDGLFDMVFSCPPYADLEKYSDHPDDISNMPYPVFLEKYRRIIAEAARLLKPGGYAAWVIGEVRNKKTGNYYGFVPDTIHAFEDAGLDYYNEITLVTAFSTAMLRTKQFTSNQKIVKVHQNIQVFRKGA